VELLDEELELSELELLLLVLLLTVDELLELLDVNSSVELLDEIGGGHSM